MSTGDEVGIGDDLLCSLEIERAEQRQVFWVYCLRLKLLPLVQRPIWQLCERPDEP